MPALFEKLGALAANVFSSIRETGQSLVEAINFWRPRTEGVSLADVESEYGRVKVSEGQRDILALVDSNTVIPRSLHDPAPMNFKREFTYTVSMYGRGIAGRADGKGGQFVHDERYITTSREMTPAEILDIAKRRFGPGGTTDPIIDVYSMTVTQAYVRS